MYTIISKILIQKFWHKCLYLDYHLYVESKTQTPKTGSKNVGYQEQDVEKIAQMLFKAINF